jgi:hypothetical protein
MTFFGYDDLNKADNSSIFRTSAQSAADVLYDTKIFKFNINRLFQTQLSQNAKIVIEQIFLPSSGTNPLRSGPITLRMNNLNTHAHDSQNNGSRSTLIYTTELSETIYTNPAPEMLYNFNISQNFFQNGFIEFQITYPGITLAVDYLTRFYISLVVYDVDEEDLLLKDTPDIDFKNFGPHMNIHNGRIPK